MQTTDILLLIFSLLFAVIGWLLKQKDQAQGEEIKALKETTKLLFQKHDDDVKALQDLRIQIAEGHYKKVELDIKFDKLEIAFKEGFSVLGKKFDHLSESLMLHMQREDKE